MMMDGYYSKFVDFLIVLVDTSLYAWENLLFMTLS